MSDTQRLDLDFIAAPRSTWLGRVVLLLGVLCVVAGAGLAATAWQARQSGQDALADLSRSSSRRVSRVPVDPALLRSAASVARELQMPWGQLLLALEGIPSRDVAVLSIEPTTAQRTLRITADARNADAMFDYLAQLKQQALTQVVLTSHQVQPQVPGTPIRFQVQARWGDSLKSSQPAPVIAATPSRVAAGSTVAIGAASKERP